MSNNPKEHQIERVPFLQHYRLTEEAFQKTGLEWSLLEQIYWRHTGMTKELQSAADYVSGRLQFGDTSALAQSPDQTSGTPHRKNHPKEVRRS